MRSAAFEAATDAIAGIPHTFSFTAALAGNSILRSLTSERMVERLSHSPDRFCSAALRCAFPSLSLLAHTCKQRKAAAAVMQAAGGVVGCGCGCKSGNQSPSPSHHTPCPVSCRSFVVSAGTLRSPVDASITRHFLLHHVAPPHFPFTWANIAPASATDAVTRSLSPFFLLTINQAHIRTQTHERD